MIWLDDVRCWNYVYKLKCKYSMKASLIFRSFLLNLLVVFLISAPLVRLWESRRLAMIEVKCSVGHCRAGPAYTHSLQQSLLFMGFHTRQVWYSYPQQHDPNKQREKDIPQTQRMRKGKRTVGGGQLWEIGELWKRERVAHEKRPLCNLILAY